MQPKISQHPLTSDTHPIRVDFLPQAVTGLPGQLGMTIAPGKRHQGMHAIWCRDLEKDLQRLRDHYHTDLLISLIEPHEFGFLQIPDLIERARSHGMRPRRFPIPDFSTPASMSELQHLVTLILEAVQQGQTVVVHCRGGLGRSGLVVASCLVALGYSPDDAFSQVRAARPGSVETEEQEAFVHQFAELMRSQSL